MRESPSWDKKGGVVTRLLRRMTSTLDHPNHENLPAGLAAGYAAFADGRLRQEQDRFRTLADKGQKPSALLIGCCDSRVSPEVIFDAGPGEIFVVRNIAALVPPYDPDVVRETSAAIEYAVLALKVAHIVVMGHTQCGGIRAYAAGEQDAFKPLSEANFIAKWKALIAPAAAQAGPSAGDFDHYCEILGHASIVQGLANLRTYPWVGEREAAGELSLHGACFGIADGGMMVLDQGRGIFVPVIPA